MKKKRERRENEGGEREGRERERERERGETVPVTLAPEARYQTDSAMRLTIVSCVY